MTNLTSKFVIISDERHLRLNWDPVEGASQYFVYYTDNPLDDGLCPCITFTTASTEVLFKRSNLGVGVFHFFWLASKNGTTGKTSEFSDSIKIKWRGEPILSLSDVLVSIDDTKWTIKKPEDIYKIVFKVDVIPAEDGSGDLVPDTKDAGTIDLSSISVGDTISHDWPSPFVFNSSEVHLYLILIPFSIYGPSKAVVKTLFVVNTSI